MKQSHLFTSPRPKRTYPVLVAFDLLCHFFICGLGLVLGLVALRLIVLTFAPNLLLAVAQFVARLLH